MHRRDALKLLATAAVSPSLSMPSELFTAFHAAHASLSNPPALQTLNAHQHATVSAMAELILPRTETPGALDARVPEFIDLILTDWYDPPDRNRFLEGLANVETLCRERFTKDFIDLFPPQQKEILLLLGDQLLRDLQSVSTNPRGYRGSAPEPDDNFYLNFRHLVLTGYFTSEVGAKQQLHAQIIPARIDFCAPATADSPGAEE